MRNNREAKKILKAFGKESYKERINYMDGFVQQKTSFMGSISYKHTLKRACISALIVILIVAFAASAYAAAVHYLNYTKIVHYNNDEYVPNNTGEWDKEVQFFEPTYIPLGYELDSYDYDEIFQGKTWIYRGIAEERLIIIQGPDMSIFHIDNERSVSEMFTIGDMECILYDFSDELLCVFQYENTLFTIIGQINRGDLEKIVKGMNIS